jgi:AraC-like DNA-binding protein
MLHSHVYHVVDPALYRPAMRGGEVELLVTCSGKFDAELVRIDLNKLWMQRGSETLPRIIHAANDPKRAPIFFLAGTSQPAIQHAGVTLSPGEIAFYGPAAVSHHVSEGACRFATMSLTPVDLAAASKAITGHELAPPRETRVIRPHPAAMARLIALHEKASKLAKEAPATLAHPAAGKALEQELVQAMVACLVEECTSGTNVGRGHAKLIARFEEFLELRQYEPVYLAEICAEIGVSERTLRNCCQEHLGMGPIRYLWLRRIHLAHRALLCADPASATVTGIATEYGFWELGRFSVQYHELFGEAPSTSLHRSPPT